MRKPTKYTSEECDKKHPDKIYRPHHESVEKSRNDNDEDDASRITRTTDSFEELSATTSNILEIVEKRLLLKRLLLCESRLSEELFREGFFIYCKILLYFVFCLLFEDFPSLNIVIIGDDDIGSASVEV